jgi:hypothetical protein
MIRFSGPQLTGAPPLLSGVVRPGGRAVADERLFPIQAYDYETGVCTDGQQVVMGLLCPELVAFYFDSQGNLLGREGRRWSDAAGKIAGDRPPYHTFNDEFKALIDAQRKAWQAELGYSPATVRVKQFHDDKYQVGIDILPDHFEDIESRTWLSEEQRQDYAESRAEWLADGNFVWWWARDYYMSADGKVEST